MHCNISRTIARNHRLFRRCNFYRDLTVAGARQPLHTQPRLLFNTSAMLPEDRNYVAYGDLQISERKKREEVDRKIRLGMRVKGTIVSITDEYGTYVDIGASRDALLHYNVKKMNLGDSFIGYVVKINENTGRVKVATWKDRRENDRKKMKLSRLEFGKRYTGKVELITKYGAFIDIGAECNGLLHKSKMAVDYISDPREAVELGQSVDVFVEYIDFDNRQLYFTMLDDQKKQELERIKTKRSIKTGGPHTFPDRASSPVAAREMAGVGVGGEGRGGKGSIPIGGEVQTAHTGSCTRNSANHHPEPAINSDIELLAHFDSRQILVGRVHNVETYGIFVDMDPPPLPLPPPQTPSPSSSPSPSLSVDTPDASHASTMPLSSATTGDHIRNNSSNDSNHSGSSGSDRSGGISVENDGHKDLGRSSGGSGAKPGPFRGLVHRSEMPGSVLNPSIGAGDLVEYRIIRVDSEHRNIGLSMLPHEDDR